MTLEQFNGHIIIPLREYKSQLKYPNIILSYAVTRFIVADSNSKYRKTQRSTRKAVEVLIINNPNEKPQIILNKVDQQINILNRDTDSIVPKNKEITSIRAVIARKNVTGITDEKASDEKHQLAYLLGQPEEKTITDPSIEEQRFLQEILFINAKQSSYVLYLNQSLTDIERFCTEKSAISRYTVGQFQQLILLSILVSIMLPK